MTSTAANSNTGTRITIERIFDTPRERVWRAWTEPHSIARWWGPQGFRTRVEKHDFRPGGRTRYVMIGPDGTEYPVEGTFKEIVPMELIVTTDEFGDEFEPPPGQTLPTGIVLTCRFEDLGDNKTKLTMHIDHPNAESRDEHENMGVVPGWNSSFDCLDEFLDLRGKLALSAEGNHELVITRVFTASCTRVFDAWTKPNLVKQWMSTPRSPMVSCEIDLRVGGAMTYRWEDAEGFSMTMTGVFKEIVVPDRIVHTEVFDEDWTGGEAEVTTTFSETSKGTEVELRIRYSSKEARDRVLASPMAEGLAINFGNLDEQLVPPASVQ